MIWSVNHQLYAPPNAPQVALRLNLCASLTALGRGAQAAEVLRELRHKIPSNPKVGRVVAHSHLPRAVQRGSSSCCALRRDYVVREGLLLLCDACSVRTSLACLLSCGVAEPALNSPK